MKFLVSEMLSGIWTTTRMILINLQIAILFAIFAVIYAAPAPKADPNLVYAGYPAYAGYPISYANVNTYPSYYGSVYSPYYSELGKNFIHNATKIRPKTSFNLSSISLLPSVLLLNESTRCGRFIRNTRKQQILCESSDWFHLTG